MTDKEPTKKPTAPKKAAKKKAAAQPAAVTVEALESIKSVLAEMKTERQSRDEQLSQLFDGLNGAFARADSINNDREDHSNKSIKDLTESIMRDHEATLKEVHEQEALADKKLGYLQQIQQQQSKRNKWIAIPGATMAVVAVIYMFYVVTIMEEAMSSMSNDMQHITSSVNNMSTRMNTISEDTRALNVHTGQMNHVMNQNVAPAMNGMNSMMPW
ncbi:MAG: hypothetical protein DIZ80_17325 [endosymbiont of Galathealinum brachiosum]|uniref:Uncharacterized protein n=1 Tax=endosymbiont of Galathealinum brachiosum TaxID=2200906 RepID=A0A370D8U5_9GAMM|nr:MAG: hypothetical protein DIZ80_17325 [endosymbiont of Galathealinum brachiosum]